LPAETQTLGADGKDERTDKWMDGMGWMSGPLLEWVDEPKFRRMHPHEAQFSHGSFTPLDQLNRRLISRHSESPAVKRGGHFHRIRRTKDKPTYVALIIAWWTGVWLGRVACWMDDRVHPYSFLMGAPQSQSRWPRRLLRPNCINNRPNFIYICIL
jgi:hypothetical protein